MRKVIGLLGVLALSGCEEKKPPPPAPVASSAPVASAQTAASAEPAGAKGTGNKDVTETVAQLPGVDESFHAAKEMGLLDAWQRAAPFKPRKFTGMKPGETAIEVGKMLVDVAVLTADTKKPISPDVLLHVMAAMDALHMPAAAKQPVEALAQEVKKGGKDTELRGKLNKLIVETLPAVEEDPSLASTAGLAMAGGYLRSLAITSKVLSSGAGADQEKLDLLHRQQENAFFLDLVSNKVAGPIKGEPAVRDALEALKKIQPSVDKAKPTVEDAKLIAAALGKYAS